MAGAVSIHTMKKQIRKTPASSEKRRLELMNKKKLTKAEVKELRLLQIQSHVDHVEYLMGQFERIKTKQIRAEARFRNLSWQLSDLAGTILGMSKGTLELLQPHE